MKIDLNRGWSFIKTCSEAFISGAELAGVSEVELPHTVSVTPFDYFDESEYQTV